MFIENHGSLRKKNKGGRINKNNTEYRTEWRREG